MKKVFLSTLFLAIIIAALAVNLESSEATNPYFKKHIIMGEESSVIICDGSGTNCRTPVIIIVPNN